MAININTLIKVTLHVSKIVYSWPFILVILFFNIKTMHFYMCFYNIYVYSDLQGD